MPNRAATNPRPAAFLDRDGTLIEDVNFLTRAEDIRLLPGSIEGMKRLREAGYLLVIVSNQSSVARGMITEPELWRIHARLEQVLAEDGLTLDAAYYCPHHPEGALPEYAKGCDCRKPKPGMLLQAAKEHHIALTRSVMIGDSERDIQAGRAAGCRTVRISPGNRSDAAADFTVRDLAEAARALAAARETRQPG